MPATSTPTFRPATERQASFIRALIAGRDSEVLSPLADEIQRFAVYGMIRGDLIDRLMALPRTARPASRAAQSVRSDDLLPTPSRGTRAGRMLNAGGIEATVTLPSGEHCTVQIRTRRPQGRGWTNAHPVEDGARTNISILGHRVGWLNVFADGRWALTLRTRRSDYRAAIEAIFQYAATGTSDLRVQESSRCGRCFRTLTDPVSIDRGIGPECFGRDTGSQHVAAEREQSGDAVRRELRESRATVTGEPGAPTEAEADRFAAGALADASAEAHRVALQQRAYEAAEAAETIRLRRSLGVETLTDRGTVSAPPFPGPAATVPSRGDILIAQNLIAEALDAYLSDDREGEADFALTIFKQLAARV